MSFGSIDHRNRIRLGAVLAATASSLIAWVVMGPLAEVELVVPAGSAVRTVGADDVVLAAVLSGVAAVATTALVDRWARRPRRTWTVIATSVFALTLLGPIGSGAETGIVGALVALHSVVAIVLIPQLRRTLPAGASGPREQPAAA